MTITDPVAFTKPWNVTRIYVKTRQAQNPGPGRSAYRNMRDGECVGVDMSKGYQSVVLPMELEAAEEAKAKAAAPARKAPARKAPARASARK